MKPIYLEKSLGIDIREESVALVLLGKKVKTIDILGAKFFQMKPLAAGDEKAEKFFLDEINKFLMEHNAWPESTVISIPRSHLTLQSFELPAPNRKTVDSMVEFELERHFSSGMEGLYFSYHISPKAENQFHIVSTAVKDETANHYLQLIHQLNLKPTILDVSTLADINLVLAEDVKDRSLSAIVDLGPNAIDITIIKDRIMEFSRNIPIDDPDFRKAYFQSDLPQEHYETLSTGLEKIIVEELQKALSSCRNISDSESIERIHLIGGGPYAPFLARQLEQDTEVSTTRALVPDRVGSAPESFSTATMTTALSLGLRELASHEIETNLLPAELKPRKKKPKIKTTFALAATVVLVLAGSLASKVMIHSKTMLSLDQQLAEIKTQVGTLEKIDLEYESLKQYIDKLNAINRLHPPKLPILMELTRILPPDTWLSQIKITGTEMQIKGFSTTASRLVPIVEGSNFFKDPGFKGSIISEGGGEKFTMHSFIQAPQ
ncbi:MAG: pilus assembly protein PilM [Nitrospinaceae bacterium]